MIQNSVILVLKGLAMGAANVIPGVSGGTIALVTGIYERIIQALRSVNLSSLGLLARGRLSAFLSAVDGLFLFWVLLGVGISVFSLARLLEWLLTTHETPTFGFFFGLIAASIYYVGQGIRKWSPAVWLLLLVGTATAVTISLLVPGEENPNPLYVGICGVVAICSMILPGLSGSFVLILMGNYTLVLRAIGNFELGILLPLALGCGFGLLGFAQLLGWLFKRFHDLTLAAMTGFVLGSLFLIWPWKATRTRSELIDGEMETWVVGYQWFLPDFSLGLTWITLGMVLLGGAVLIAMEFLASRKPSSAERA
jgi:putative membrane protein